jgi:hypothetical protein
MKKVIRLTESDLTRIVRRVIKEGASVERVPKPWNEIAGIMKGDTMTSFEEDILTLMRGGEFEEKYNNFSIIQNPRQVQMSQVGAMNVVSFDPNKKTVTFNNGLMIGPA